MVKFGLDVSGFNVVNYFSRNLDNVLIGHYWGAGALGFYSRAYHLLMWPIQYIRVPLALVAVPALSRIQDDPMRFRRYCMKIASLLAFITMPLMVLLTLLSGNIVAVLLGPKWSIASPIFAVMAITGFVQAPAGIRGVVALSSGHSRRYFKFGLANSVVTVASFIAGLSWGAFGVAVAYAVVNYLASIPSLWYCFRRTPMNVSSFLKAILSPMVASLGMGAAVYPCLRPLAGHSDIMIVGICLLVAAPTYFLILALLPGGIPLLREIVALAYPTLRREAATDRRTRERES